MVLTRRGVVQDGHVIVPDPVDLPDGTEVIVLISAGEHPRLPTPEEVEAFDNLPAHGMWADREDMGDTDEWLQKMRKQWWRSTPFQD